MATIYIDNKPYEVKAGKNLLEACLSLGLDLPYFCYHPAMGSIGACRQCAVKVYRDENDTKGKLFMSCMEQVRDNMRVSIADMEAREFRAHVIGWLMTNHPHDCAVCDEGGSCHLQDMTVMTGHNYRAYRFDKRTYINQYLGPFLNHEMNRCIQCYRCVRYYKDYAGGKDLDVFAAHNHLYFGRAEDGVLESEFSGNLAEVCPTGVFTDKTLKQHYTRKWDLTMAPSVCHHCSVGCNTIAGERYGTLRNITNRYNGEVNGYFLCDRGRFGYEFVNSAARVRKPLVRSQLPEASDKYTALKAASSAIKAGRVIGIGSPRASLESNYVLKKLVGEDNFHHGVSDVDHDLVEMALHILKEGSARTPSLQEVEKADSVFILGEDLTNTAPMLALAVRQSVRQQPLLEQVSKANIPVWQDAAVRELVQTEKGPLFIAHYTTSKLDELATQTYFDTPDAIARLGFAVANFIHPDSPEVHGLTEEELGLAQQIANALLAAHNPLVISGTSSGNERILKAAANIANALAAREKSAVISLVVPECNSMGLAMLGGHKLESAFEAVLNGYADTVIILENDLYRRASAATVTEFLDSCKQILVLDHLHHATTEKANILLPAAPFSEADGTLVNNEGRAQRFFQVYPTPEEIQESWHWLAELGTIMADEQISNWQGYDDLVKSMAEEIPALRGVKKNAPSSDFRVAGQRIPRAPHRFSGRTAMHAGFNVSEPKPPTDPDSPLSYTMEGYRGQPPSSMIPFFWAPGWNSVQATNKYQQEVGGHLKGGDPGVRLIEPAGTAAYSLAVPQKFVPLGGHLYMLPLHHIFGSEELSNQSPPIMGRIPAPYVAINTADAIRMKLDEGDLLSFSIEGQAYQLPVKTSHTIPSGTAGLPNGLPGVPFAELPAWAILNRDIKWKQQPQTTF
ncbi:NADH dehydrogenase subunit G [Pontibacter ummariensis]|uniref:NADH-quinone oxidoreductase subunit G n=1 Tax=Pontibacter ummariensis TaxID=1610492 RepID=A0A239GKX2_9BACT|nr:NADH-quinone oxidoreductase subunit NuoG [Pontibacter ummariensis]PRY11328.1 NADH dehydrogenase subunit G [Pontibacter ummariensis]SNS69936.1 NADH dehydrogenase subunit G [Pontibacter ummariensis]